jgi:hypothetical protein
MKRKTTSHIATGLTLALILAAVALFYFEARDASRAGDSTPLYSVRRHDPYGTAALRDLLVETGVKVRNLERPRLERTDQGTLVQVLQMPDESFWREEPQVQAPALLQWISEGNTVIQFTRSRTELMDLAGVPGEPTSQTVAIAPTHFGPTTAPAHPTTAPNQPTTTAPAIGRRVRLRQPSNINSEDAGFESTLRFAQKWERAGRDPTSIMASCFVGEWNDPAAQSKPKQSQQRMSLESPWALPRHGPAGWTPIVVASIVANTGKSEVEAHLTGSMSSSLLPSESDANVLVGAMRIGQGRLIVVTSPSPALNYGIVNHDNLPCILSMIGPGPVIFDEWSHGLGHGGTIVSFLREVGLTPLLMQIALVLALYSWSTRGHDRQDAPTAPRRRSVAEQVQTLGHLYAGTLPIDTVYAHVNDTVQMRMCGALRCSRADLNQRLSQLSPELRKSAQAIRAALVVAERSDFPACPSCGYDLTGHQASQCSECGASIPLSLRERIALTRADHSMHALKPEQNTTPSAPSTTVKPARRARAEAQLARALTLSSEFVKEVARDRRSANSVTGNV